MIFLNPHTVIFTGNAKSSKSLDSFSLLIVFLLLGSYGYTRGYGVRNAGVVNRYDPEHIIGMIFWWLSEFVFENT